MAASRAVSSQRLCSRYRRFFFIASFMLATQLFLAFSFYSTYQKDAATDRRTKYEPSWDSETGFESRGLVADSSVSAGKGHPAGYSVRNVQHLRDSGLKGTEKSTDNVINTYKSRCNISSPEAVSALSRAKTGECKQQIADIVCQAQAGTLYPKSLPRFCPLKGNDTGEYKGCFQDNYKSRDLTGHHADFPLDNSPTKCTMFCLQAGFKYAGVQYGRECWCGDSYGNHGSLPEGKCKSLCPHDIREQCGGHLAMRVFSTGLGKKIKHGSHFVKGDRTHPANGVRIAYVLTFNGRALRQVLRLFKAIFHVNHYYFIHVDVRQEYLHRELSRLLSVYPNVRISKTRFATIWGGASLLTMLLHCMKELLDIKEWKWDYFVNLSESDFPIQTDSNLVAFLTNYRGFNFLRSHGRDTPRFIKKQGLDKTFYQCENRMWRLGSRTLPTGIRIDGGSDWVGLHRDFCQYVTTSTDELVTQLKHLYGFALLPAESFFHTVLQNSKFCEFVIDNNLHLTNWRRKQGCKCQYKHIVDWCGCSPNDFKPEDFEKILSVKQKPTFFARKFEAIVNQEIINDVDAYLYGAYPTDTLGLNSYWQNEFHHLDQPSNTKDSHLTFYHSFMRLVLRDFLSGSSQCNFRPVKLLLVTLFSEANHFHGLLVMFQAELLSTGKVYTLESHLHPVHVYKVLNPVGPIGRLKTLQVGENFDPKERLFRNFGGLLGPYSDVVLKHVWGEGEPYTLSVAWVDPAKTVAASYDVDLVAGGNTASQKPDLQKPLRPGMWTVKVMYKWQVVAETSFLVVPLTVYKGRAISAVEATLTHSGPSGLYAGRDFSDFVSVLQLEDVDTSKRSAAENAQKAGRDLEVWVDSLIGEFWRVEGSCSEGGVLDTCPYLDQCEVSSWSSLSPDPKSELTPVNKLLGRIR